MTNIEKQSHYIREKKTIPSKKQTHETGSEKVKIGINQDKILNKIITKNYCHKNGFPKFRRDL